MAKLNISALVEGGKASPAPPLGPALGPTGLTGVIIPAINEKTKAFAGMQVPVKISVDTSSKTFEIEVGTPPTSGLIKSELGIKEPVKEEAGVKGKKAIGNLTIPQLLHVIEMKHESMLSRTKKSAALMVIGTCQSLGVTVEGKIAKDFAKEVTAGKFDKQLKD
ncbi:MAG TPA: 50S ribosomal protein L11 [Candidatus Norongarragalinales archaeon]|jgi:large subunit ribosomal protein L11|nr:50S ribosomal protein L11 [Candidatus Norongarragalinales archaeon]